MIHCNSEFRAYALIRQIYSIHRSTQMCIEHSLAVLTTTSHDYIYLNNTFFYLYFISPH